MAGPEAHPVPDSGTFRTNLSYELVPITYHPRTSRPFSNAQPGPYCLRYSPGTQFERCFGDGWIMTRLLLYSKEPLPAKGLEGVRDPGNSAQDAAAPTPGELSATSAGGRSVV